MREKRCKVGKKTKENPKIDGKEKNIYLKERLASQLHTSETWKRKCKQASSLGYLGVLRSRGRRGNKKKTRTNVPEWVEKEQNNGGEQQDDRMHGKKFTEFYREQNWGKIKAQIIKGEKKKQSKNINQVVTLGMKHSHLNAF